MQIRNAEFDSNVDYNKYITSNDIMLSPHMTFIIDIF